MERTRPIAAILATLSVVLLLAGDAGAERRHRRPRAEVVAWAADASVVVFAEPTRGSRHGRELVVRRVPTGEVVARAAVFPGPCARRIEGRVAIAHACALALVRPRMPSRLRRRRFHVAATSRSRIMTITLRADGSVVEHELPNLGLVLRGRTEEERGDRTFAVLEVAPLDRDGESEVLDRRPIRTHARRRWTLLQAGDRRYIVVGRGVLRRIVRQRRDHEAPPRRGHSGRHRPPG